MLVLASASPRRQELLRNAGIPFIVRPTNISEDALPGEGPRDCAERLAREKALALPADADDFVLGADTVVFVAGEMIAKPVDAQDAARMLRMLSGRTHQVITGVCLVRSMHNGFPDTRSENTRVTMKPMSEEEIRQYVSSGEPMDKAGGYGIQGIASRWISRIEGDYFNVVGLPVSLVYTMLREHGAI
jgi:septum formation protein